METYDRTGLMERLFEEFRVDRQGIHGASHWARVKHHGLAVGRLRGADLLVVELFAFLHDSCRHNEGPDHGHGARGAEFAHGLNGRFFHLAGDRLDRLCTAIRGHSDGELHRDATVQTCWDADRLDLGRVGTTPSAKYLSVEAAAFIDSAYDWSRRSPR